MARDTLYPKMPITVTYKTSNRSNARTKKKTFKTKNIDEILEGNYAGIPDTAIIEHIGMGSKFAWNDEYED